MGWMHLESRYQGKVPSTLAFGCTIAGADPAKRAVGGSPEGEGGQCSSCTAGSLSFIMKPGPVGSMCGAGLAVGSTPSMVAWHLGKWWGAQKGYPVRVQGKVALASAGSTASQSIPTGGLAARCWVAARGQMGPRPGPGVGQCYQICSSLWGALIYI